MAAADWTLPARKFIATGKPEYLAQAAKTCQDPEIREFLQRDDLAKGMPSPEVFSPLVNRLQSEDRASEAVVVSILGFRRIALAADSPERLSAEISQFAEQTCTQLAALSQQHDFQECEAIFACTLGTRAAKQRQLPNARALLSQALDLYRALAETEPNIYRPYVAMTLNNLGNVLRNQRDFPSARAAYEEAVPIYRALAETEPNIYRPDVAGTLNNLGNVLSNQRDFPSARAAYEEALKIRRKLPKTEPNIYRPDVARTLTNLGNVLAEQRDFPSARAAIEEALSIYRKLDNTESNIYRPDVAMVLHNLGNVLAEQRDFPSARTAFEEAVSIYRKLAETEPNIYRPNVAGTLNSLLIAREAVEAAELTGWIAKLSLAKGNALGAYWRLLEVCAKREDAAEVFGLLAALREGSVCALDGKAGERLSEAADALAHVRKESGRDMRIVIAQRLGENSSLLAVLSENRAKLLAWEVVEDFHAKADELYDDVLRVAIDKKLRPFKESSKTMRDLGTAAWNALPETLRETLDPSAGHDVLISGDPYWNGFPWEALCTGPNDDDWLGLVRPLTRWGPLTAAALDRLAPKPFGGDQRTAAILCPCYAVGLDKKQAPYLMVVKKFHSKTEAMAHRVRDQLTDNDYTLVPDGEPVLFEKATPEMLEAMLAQKPTVLHYTGHGTILGNEEVLCLSDGKDEPEDFRYFGRKELGDLAFRLERERVLEHGPLVTLVSCWTGRTRDHGGAREDLASALLRHGAEGVVASGVPVFVDMGLELGELVYTGGKSGMAHRTGMARAIVERSHREKQSKQWPAWALIHYQGNPLAYLLQDK